MSIPYVLAFYRPILTYPILTLPNFQRSDQLLIFRSNHFVKKVFNKVNSYKLSNPCTFFLFVEINTYEDLSSTLGLFILVHLLSLCYINQFCMYNCYDKCKWQVHDLHFYFFTQLKKIIRYFFFFWKITFHHELGKTWQFVI